MTSRTMNPRAIASSAAEFVELTQDFLVMHAALANVFSSHGPEEIPFETLRSYVGDDDESVLFRVKQKSHGLFRRDHFETAALRREALFDLAVGALFHDAMKLREDLYQREVYAPRVASLQAAADDEEQALFEEFARNFGKSGERLLEGVARVRVLLSQTRDQFRQLLVSRADERGVTRCLLARRELVARVFPEGFEGLLETMHGSVAIGLVDAARALIDSAYFVEGAAALREAAREPDAPGSEIAQLELYAEGMQAFLSSDYSEGLTAIEAWLDASGHLVEREFARRAGAVLSRIERLVVDEPAASDLVDLAKQLASRIDIAS